MIKKRILIVEAEGGERQRLAGLFLGSKEEWDVTFVDNYTEALALTSQVTIDAVLSDMPQLAVEVSSYLSEMAQWPRRVPQFFRADFKDKELLTKLFGPVPQFIDRTWDAARMELAIRRAFWRDMRLLNKSLQDLVSQMRELPSVSSLYCEVLHQLQSADPNIEQLGLLVSRDLAMSAKVLQIVNSAYFGLSRQISSAAEAVLYLGIQSLKALLLFTEFASHYEASRCPLFSLQELWHHSMATAALARQIALAEKNGAAMAEEAFTGGLLHDIGKLMLAANMPDLCNQTLAVANRNSIPLWEAELATFGTSHAELGACLLCSWELPLAILDAIVWHHAPVHSGSGTFSPIVCVHVANALDHENHVLSPKTPQALIDLDYLRAIGLEDRCDGWREMCRPLKSAQAMAARSAR